MPRAASLAAAIKQKTGVEPSLVAGRGGIFQVRVDGRLIWDKFQTHRFPEHAEILALLGVP